MMHGLGPRARRVYAVLHDRIAHGDWLPGSRLPSHRDLAVEFGVAPMTMRQVLGQLEEQGLVSRQVGRGTFVRDASGPAILIVEADAAAAALLAEYVRSVDYRPLIAGQAEEALRLLASDPGIVLALCNLCMPTVVKGQEIIQAVSTRHPGLPLAALVTELADVSGLFGTPAWPLHILPHPVNLGLLD
jgi:DNA-binding transcriptional regulator YhcF (GntR family)